MFRPHRVLEADLKTTLQLLHEAGSDSNTRGRSVSIKTQLIKQVRGKRGLFTYYMMAMLRSCTKPV